MEKMGIRKPSIKDLDPIFQIEMSSFPIPWSKDVFRQIIRNTGQYMMNEYVVIIMRVIANDESVNGYIVWEENYNQKSGHVLNLAVKEEERNKGYGFCLLEYALCSMREAGLASCRLEVREGNLIARNLYSKMGMMAISRAKQYYSEEDAIIYSIAL